MVNSRSRIEAEEVEDDLGNRLLSFFEVIRVLAGLELGQSQCGLDAHRGLLVASAVE